MVRPPYSTLVTIIEFARTGWEHIEGDAAWRGIDPWSLGSLSLWCSFVVRWYRSRLEHAKPEERDRFEYLLQQPVPRLWLYTLAQDSGRKALTQADGGFLAAMQGMQQAKG